MPMHGIHRLSKNEVKDVSSSQTGPILLESDYSSSENLIAPYGDFNDPTDLSDFWAMGHPGVYTNSAVVSVTIVSGELKILGDSSSDAKIYSKKFHVITGQSYVFAGAITDVSSTHSCTVGGGNTIGSTDYFASVMSSAGAISANISGSLTFTATSDIFWLTLTPQGISSSFMISDNLSLTGIVHPYITNSTNKNYAEGEFSKIIPLASRTEVSAKSNIGQDLSTDGTFSVVDPKSITLTTDSILDNHHDGNSVYGNFSKVLVNAGRVLLVPTTKEVLPRLTTINNQYSASFDGVNDYIEIPDSNDFSFGDGSDDSAFSISAWIKMDVATSFPIVTKGVYNSDAEWRFWVHSDGKLNLALYDESVSNTFEKAYYNTALSADTWYHVVATYNGDGGTSANGGILLYIDGSLVADTHADSGTYVAMENLTSSVYIGKYSTDYANGNIDEVSIWNKELSRDEIRYHLCDYNYDNSNSVRPMDLTLHDTFATNCKLWMRMGD